MYMEIYLLLLYGLHLWVGIMYIKFTDSEENIEHVLNQTKKKNIL